MRLTGTVAGRELGVGLIRGDNGNYYAFSVFDAITNKTYDFTAGARVVFTPSECGPAAVEIAPFKEEPPRKDFLALDDLTPPDTGGSFCLKISQFSTKIKESICFATLKSSNFRK